MKNSSFSLAAMLSAVLLVKGTIAFGYTSMSVAVDSNLLAYEGKLLFAQGTGSLTQIELNTGKVLNRAAPPKEMAFSGTLYRHGHGIFMADYSRSALLDESTLEVLWSVEDSHDAAIGDNYFVSHDGYDTVTCFDVASGKQAWSKTMHGGWILLARGDVTVIATPLIYDEGHAILVVDMPTGNELFKLKAEPGLLFLNVYLDDEAVYVLTGKNEPNVLSHDASPVELRKFNLAGELQSSIDVMSEEVIWEYGYKTARHGFFLGDRYFEGNGHVRKTYDHEPDAWQDTWGQDDLTSTSLPSGILIEGSFRDSSDERATFVAFKGSDYEWRGYLSHLGEEGWVGQSIEHEGNLVVASGQGHVECFDIVSGRPRWLYVFPEIRRTMSFSSHAMPPTLTQQAASYHVGMRSLGEIAGTLTVGNEVDLSSLVLNELRKQQSYAGAITIDPSPDDPFAGLLPDLVIRATLFAVAPVAILASVALALRQWRRRVSHAGLLAWDYHLLSGIALCLLLSPMLGVLLYGRVDRIVTFCLWSMVVLCVVASIACGRMAKREERVAA